MVNETGDVPKTVETGSGSGGTTIIDWTTYHFPSQLIYRVCLINLVVELFFLFGRKRRSSS